VTGKERRSALKTEVTVITSREDLQQALPEWQAFASDPGVQGGVWCDPVTVSETASFDKGDSVLLARLSDGGIPVAFMPFSLGSRIVSLSIGLWGVGRPRARVARLYDFNFAARENVDRLDAIEQAFAGVRDTVACDIITAPNCSIGSGNECPGTRAAGLRGLSVRNVQDTFLVDLSGDFDQYLSALSSNTRQTLKRKLRRIERESGAAVTAKCFRKVSDMSELRSCLAGVWQRSWHGRLGRYEPPSVSFLSRLAEEGWIRSYVLFVGDNPAASVLGLQYRGTFLDEAPAHDQRWRDHSPGIVLNYLILQDLFSVDPPRRVDFGFGYNQYKETLGTRRDTRAELWLAASGRGRGLVMARRLSDAIFKRGKMILGRSGMVRKLKERARGGARR